MNKHRIFPLKYTFYKINLSYSEQEYVFKFHISALLLYCNESRGKKKKGRAEAKICKIHYLHKCVTSILQ